MESWMKQRPISVHEILSWIEANEVGVITHDEAVQRAVSAWAKKRADFNPQVTISDDEVYRALLDGGAQAVTDLLQKKLCEVATEAMAWGSITTFQRMQEPWVSDYEVSADE